MSPVIGADQYFRLGQSYVVPRKTVARYPGRRLRVVSSWLPRAICDPAELEGEAVVQGLGPVIVLKVRPFAHPPPWQEGESCALLVAVPDAVAEGYSTKSSRLSP